MLFGSGHKKQVGIDVGTNSIKVVEVELTGKEVGTLLNYGVANLYHLESVNVKNLPSKDLAAAIMNVFRQAKIRSGNVAIGIGVEESFTAFIRTPMIEKEKLDQAISYEMKKYLPMDVSEVKLGYKIVSTNPSSQEMSVLAVAVPRSIIEKYKNVTQIAGLRLITLEVETFSMVRALGQVTGTVLIVNIGALKSSIGVIKQGYALLNSTLELGGVHFTKAIVKAANVDFERAEAMKIKDGLTGQVKEMLTSQVDRFVAEVQSLATRFQNEHGEKVANIILLGQTSQMIGLKEYFTNAFQSFRILDVSISGKVQLPQGLSEETVAGLTADMSVAVGLALQQDE